MKNNIRNIIIGLLIASGILSCTKDFEDINKNPNYPEQVSSSLLLTNILYSTARSINSEAIYNGNGLAQYTARFDFNDLERYDLGSNPEFWTTMYGLMRDINNLTDMADEQGNNGYIAIGLIMKAYIISHITDLWGDVPYFDALGGKNGNFNPVYDSQKDIYTFSGGIMDNLKKANEILKTSSAVVQGDIIYNGDLSKWRKFANSLRLRYLLRISSKGVDAGINIGTEMTNIISNEPIFQNNSENALMKYLTSFPNQFIFHTVRDGDFNLFRLSDMLDETLKGLNDPRLSYWFRPTEASEGTGSPEYKGMPVGLNTRTQLDLGIQLTEVSRMSRIFREEPNSVDAVLMSYSEVNFILAEAAARSIISGGLSAAQSYYNAAITGSFQYHGVSIPAGYTALADVSLNSTAELNKILTQKWIANFSVGYEGWYDFRRTGMPSLKTLIDNANGGLVPSRYFYPNAEQSLNYANYKAAVDLQGGTDNINSRIWWEK